MAKEIPTADRSPGEEGFHAKHGDDPTLASYLSSLFFLLSVPTFIGLAYGGYAVGWYSYPTIVPVFGVLVFVSVVAVFALMHVLTGK